MPADLNPRGEKRPRDGRGKGVGMKGGRRGEGIRIHAAQNVDMVKAKGRTEDRVLQ